MANYLGNAPDSRTSHARSVVIPNHTPITISWSNAKLARLNPPMNAGSKVRPLYGQMFPR